MKPLNFNIPDYPHLRRFSDPNGDFDGQEDELESLADCPPNELSAEDICFIFNSWLPAGTFEEMAPYIPRALELMATEEQGDCESEIVQNVLPWCYVEEKALFHAPRMLISLKNAFAQLFTLWTSTTAARFDEDCYIPLYADHVLNLLDWGRFTTEQLQDYHTPLLWLTPEHYLPQLLALDSVAHAAWLLWLSDAESTFPVKPITLPSAKRRKAVNMVAAWLSDDVAPEEAAVWSPCLERHQQTLTDGKRARKS